MDLSNSRIREVIWEYVQGERDRRIIERRLIDKIGLERLAEEFQLSDTQVKRIVKKWSIVIFRHY